MVAIGCGARTAIEADGSVDETESEEEVTTSSSGAGTSGPSQDDCDAATSKAYEAANVIGADRDDIDKAVIDACCAAGCRPRELDTHLIECFVECIANPQACTADQECRRGLHSDGCGIFPNAIVMGRCSDP